MFFADRLRGTDRLMLAVMVFALAGCGSGGGTGGSAASGQVDFATVRSMALIYRQYLGTHNDRSPPDEKAFRDFLATKQEYLERAKLTVDKMFTSPRNGQPLAWVTGQALPVNGEMGRCFAYEATPTDGKRLVIGDGGHYTLMDDAAFRTLFPNVK